MHLWIRDEIQEVLWAIVLVPEFSCTATCQASHHSRTGPCRRCSPPETTVSRDPSRGQKMIEYLGSENEALAMVEQIKCAKNKRGYATIPVQLKLI